MIYEIIKELENTPSTNAKIQILKDNDSPLLRRVLFMALNKYLRYGFKKLPKPMIYAVIPPKSLSKSLDFIERDFQGNQRSTERELLLASIMGCLSENDLYVFRRVILKDLKCGVARSLVNKAFPKLIPNFKVLLAQPGKEKHLKNLKYPAMAQIKYDGARANFDIDDGGEITSFTRNGNIMNLFGRFENSFPTSVNHRMIDGELLVFDDNGKRLSRKDSNGLITKATRGTLSKSEANTMKFVAWDIVDRDNFINQETQITPCKTRYENVKALLDGYSPNVLVAESKIVNSYDEALEYYEECIANGEEGIIIKNIDGVWELKRSNNLVKMKAEHDADLIIVGLKEGTEGGKREGVLGSFILETRCGKLQVDCGSGFSDKQVIEYWDESLIGSVVAVTYNEKLKTNKKIEWSLYLPIFQEIRYDKNAIDANTLVELE